MDKGQHLRLFITESTTNRVIAFSTELTLQGNAQTENSTTKDTTDGTGVVWDEYEVMTRTAQITFSALVAAGTDSDAKTFADILGGISDTPFDWKIAFASGTNNRTIGQVIVSGKGKFSNVQATGQVGQNTTYSGTINVYGPLVPGVIS